MEWFIVIFYLLLLILGIALSYKTLSYFIMMWKYKQTPKKDRRKKFKHFD